MFFDTNIYINADIQLRIIDECITVKCGTLVKQNVYSLNVKSSSSKMRNCQRKVCKVKDKCVKCNCSVNCFTVRWIGDSGGREEHLTSAE